MTFEADLNLRNEGPSRGKKGGGAQVLEQLLTKALSPISDISYIIMCWIQAMSQLISIPQNIKFWLFRKEETRPPSLCHSIPKKYLVHKLYLGLMTP